MITLDTIVRSTWFRMSTYIGCALLLCHGAIQMDGWYQFVEFSTVIVWISIGLTMLDRKNILPGFKQYTVETIYRCALLLALAIIVLSHYTVLASKSNMLHTLGILMYMAYIQSWLYAHKLHSPPTRLLSLGHYSHTLFIVLLLVGVLGEIYISGALIVITSLILIGSTTFNRYLLWLGGATPYNNEQAVAVWRKLLSTPEAEHTQYARLWNHTKNYILQYPESIEPLKVGLSVLPLPVLLSCLEKFELIHDPAMLQTLLRNAIEQLEPRAQWIWHLYDNEQACKTIASLTAMNSNEPPPEDAWAVP